MGIIQCSQGCRFQIDGYCYLDKCSCVNSVTGECPYFVAVSADNGDGLSERGDADKL